MVFDSDSVGMLVGDFYERGQLKLESAVFGNDFRKRDRIDKATYVENKDR